MGYRATNDDDTIVLPLFPWKYDRVFVQEHKCQNVRISPAMVNKIHYLATYFTKPRRGDPAPPTGLPTQAITHVAGVTRIEPQTDGKYTIWIDTAPQTIGPIRWTAGGRDVYRIFSARYASYERLLHAKTLVELWPAQEAVRPAATATTRALMEER